MAGDVDVRQELLGRIRAHQESINRYVRKTQHRRDLVANISIVSSTIAAALVVGPVVGSVPFVETVQEGPGWKQDSSVWRLLFAASLAVYLVAATSAKLKKSEDLAVRISAAEACNAALERLRADVEFSKLSVKVAVGEYGQFVARALFVPENSADDTDSNDRARLEVVIPGMVIVLAGVILPGEVVQFS